MRLAPGLAEVVDEAPSGLIYVDGGVMTPANSEPLRERRHAAANGALMVAVTLDKRGRLAADVTVRALGLPGDAEYPLEDALDDLADDAEGALKRLDNGARDDDRLVEQAVARVLKKSAQRIWERRPVVETLVPRLNG